MFDQYRSLPAHRISSVCCTARAEVECGQPEQRDELGRAAAAGPKQPAAREVHTVKVAALTCPPLPTARNIAVSTDSADRCRPAARQVKRQLIVAAALRARGGSSGLNALQRVRLIQERESIWGRLGSRLTPRPFCPQARMSSRQPLSGSTMVVKPSPAAVKEPVQNPKIRMRCHLDSPFTTRQTRQGLLTGSCLVLGSEGERECGDGAALEVGMARGATIRLHPLMRHSVGTLVELEVRSKLTAKFCL